MSTTVWESYHLRAPLEKVWALVRPVNFAYLPTVVRADEGKASLAEVGAHRQVTYKDGTIQTIRVTGISELDFSVSWELELSAPATAFAAQTHTVRLRRVTEGNTTFVEWSTLFSSDASTEVVQDAKYKQADNFAALAVALGVPPSQPRLTLFYFPGRGAAEVSRLLLAQAGLAYEDVRLTREEWAKKKPGVVWGQMPLLAVDGKEYAQSGAIERYVARLGGLAGANAFEWAQIDSLAQAVLDARRKFVSAVSPYENKTEDEKKVKLAAYFAAEFKTWTPFFVKALESNKSGSGWLVGKKISYADIALYNFYSAHKQVKADSFADFPSIEAWLGRVAAQPRIAKWLRDRPVTAF